MPLGCQSRTTEPAHKMGLNSSGDEGPQVLESISVTPSAVQRLHECHHQVLSNLLHAAVTQKTKNLRTVHDGVFTSQDSCVRGVFVQFSVHYLDTRVIQS